MTSPMNDIITITVCLVVTIIILGWSTCRVIETYFRERRAK